MSITPLHSKSNTALLQLAQEGMEPKQWSHDLDATLSLVQIQKPAKLTISKG